MSEPRPTSAPSAAEAWYRRPADDALTHFQSSASGLSATEAAQRLAANGPNVLTEATRIGAWQIFIGQFKSLIIWILIAAGIVSGVLGEALDAIAILAVVVLNAVIGFYQEFSAEKSIAALKAMTAPHATVQRDGQPVSVPASDIVTGDILTLAAGDVIPADGRLLESAALACVESALTGESETVAKRSAALEQADVPLADRENMVFMGTSVAAGSARAVVVATAMRTELGLIAGLIEQADADKGTPLQRRLDAFGRVLVWAALAIVAVLFGLGLLRGTALLELTMTSISLAVAAVPEGLPAVVTVALSLGVLRMARRRALVRKLAAVETLGSTSVICTDKTGTLTVGEMTARALYVAGRRYEVTGEGYGPEGNIRVEGQPTGASDAAALLELAHVLVGCNNAHIVQDGASWKAIGDPTEGALLAAGTKAGGDRERLDREWPRRQEIPFDSDRKRSAVVRQKPDGTLRVFVNGAPGPLLERCTHLYTATGVRALTDDDRAGILGVTSDMARQALRVLGSAVRDMTQAPADPLTADAVEQDLVFVGLTGMYDPPRPEAKDAIETCRAAGIRVVMITGDHPHTASAIARELGIAADAVAVTGVDLDRMADDELRRRAPDVSVYARVTAQHKLRIVRALKAGDAVVAMTGDGVNDAPAIKGADIGIAMGRSGTDVTKQAADMIITDDNFATIVAAVEEGRGIYDNIRKTLQYLLAGNTGELLLMTGCVAANLPAPLLPIHLLWINLVTDGLPAVCLAADPIDPDVMADRPRRRSARIADRAFLRTMVFTGVLTAAVAFTVYLYGMNTGNAETARTYAFGVLVFAELLRSFGARSDSKPVWRVPLRTNLNLVAVVALSVGLQLWGQHSAMLQRVLRTSSVPLTDGMLLLAVGAIPLCGLELVKAVRRAISSRGAATLPPPR